ncbi:CGNR zinc finger domain-containing protein [Streptomyces sp. NPDC091377]|uniref:CGNR zinc finger domain-containing protein n=1 Tax=Streptomyces sp. NPDC091377 TaxID=3365995 RepID=UPI003806353D
MRYIRWVDMSIQDSAPDRSARHSVLATARRAADLVNVLTAEADATVDAVAAVLRSYGEAEPVTLTPDDVRAMRTAAGLLREVFAAGSPPAQNAESATGTVDGAALVLNRLLQEHTGPLRLTAHGGATPWHPHLDRDDDGPWDAWLLASSCMALAVLLWDHQRPPGRVCASPSCGRVFIAHGSGPERRYCSRRCATRERVAAHRRARSG